MFVDPGFPSPFPAVVQAPASAPLSARVPLAPPPSALLLPVNSSFDGNCSQLPAPIDTQGDYDHLTNDELNDLHRRRGYAREDSKAVPKTRLAPMDAVERKRNSDMADTMDTSGTSPGKRSRAMDDAAGTSDNLLVNQEKRRRPRELHVAAVADKGISKDHSQWREPGM